MLKTTGAIFADILEEAGIDYVFGLPGGATPLILDPLVERKDKIKTVLARHEGGAACMADMYGRLTGKPGILVGQGLWIGTSGAYGIVESYMSGVPMVIITDITDYGSLPQFGPYQDGSGDYGSVNLPQILRSMTKYTTFVSNASEFAHGVQLAIKHATTGRPGPAAVVMKFDVSYAAIDTDAMNPKFFPTAGYLNTAPPCISENDARAFADMLASAKNPVMIAGCGIHRSRAYDEVRELAELLGIPVATSYMGKSAIPETHDLALGTMGAIGQKTANEYITGADVILAVGTALSPENTKLLSPDFIKPETQKIIQIDIESRNIGWTYPVVLGAVSDAKSGLSAVIKALKGKSAGGDAKKRTEAVKKKKAELKYFNEDVLRSDEEPMVPERVVNALNAVAGPDDLIVLDGGNNRMWVTHHFQSRGAGQVLAPGGAAAVGYSPPASLAAQILRPKQRVIGISGDGGLMMHLYTLEMAKIYNIPVTFLVFNNSCLGNV
ncbi:MAG TPA: thiamine pyrophosphate-binding protein, partial [Spirochaetes bacterium]|nr:thiamine pyrophosphate-binding protein [Spirochaetota bacterium]